MFAKPTHSCSQNVTKLALTASCISGPISVGVRRLAWSWRTLSMRRSVPSAGLMLTSEYRVSYGRPLWLPPASASAECALQAAPELLLLQAGGGRRGGGCRAGQWLVPVPRRSRPVALALP